MIYQLTKTIQTESDPEVHTFEIDDTVFLSGQPNDFKKFFEEIRQGDAAGFDNATVILLETDRVLVTLKDE